ncbi:hypothetical protein BBP40_005978 [Aspergillus hancockii]|nr:hypothetical protein BBP40_005978 [Aspergillus hancockii]
MELETVASSRKLIEAFERATGQFNLCPNRVWAVAKDRLPQLLPDATSMSHVTENTTHELCTFDFCEYSQRDFTAVQQRHECKEKAKCVRIRGRFSRNTLNKAALAGKSTTWQLDGKALLNLPLPYMAVSHVWSDGTGTGGQEGEVNKCLYGFLHDIAARFQCKGIWWDTLCIPKDNLARAHAIKEMHNNYQDARLTLVHDCFLRNWQWSGAEAACFAILMSPWFSRGWTALELAKSPKVKVVFKGPCGPIIKDLDEEILAGEDDNTSAGHRVATDIIRNLRKRITTLDGLLTVLTTRPDSLWTPLHYAIWRGMDSRFAELVETADPYVFDTLQQLPIHLAAERGSRGSNANAECTHGNTALHIAAEKGYEAIVTVLLMQGAIDARNEDGLTALHYAVMGGHTEIAERLIQKFGNIETRDSHMGWTPLHYAADCGHQVVVDLLLRNGAEVNATDEKVLWTPLHFATMKGHITIARLLLDDGADATAKDKYGWTPLRFASEGNHLDLIRVFADVGANIDSKDEEINWTLLHCAAFDGQPIKLLCTKDTAATNLTPLLYSATNGFESAVQRLLEMNTIAGGTQDMYSEAMHLAATNGHERIVQLLLPLIHNVNCLVSASHLRPLSAAAKEGHLAIVQLLLDHGADVNMTGVSKSGYDLPLYLATENEHEGVVELLLRHGADPNVSRNTPLHMAATSGNEVVIRLLLDHGADVNAKFLDSTPILAAVLLGHEEAVQLLLNRGADIKDSHPDMLLLHLAVERGYTGIVHLLLNHGADIEQEDGEGYTPAFIAALHDQGDMLVLLAQRQIHEGRTLLHEAADDGDEDMLRSFLKHGAPVDLRDSLQKTPLHYAASNKAVKPIQILLDRGAEVDAKDSGGRTPLFYAALCGHNAVVKLLVSSGGGINIKDKTGWGLLHYAAVHNSEELGLLLFENGADSNVKGLQDWTPLHCAAWNGHTRVVKALIDHGANVNAEDSYGRFPLHLAASNEHKDIVQILLDGGTKIAPEVG